MNTALIFDLDGTLVDSLPGIAASLNRALESKSLKPHPLSAVRSFIGNGTFVTAQKSLPPDAPDSLILEIETLFKADYADTWLAGSEPYPGIPELLESLQANNHLLAVLSNKPHPFTVEMVGRLFPDTFFAPTLGQQPEIPRKPAPDAALLILEHWQTTAAEARFVGDSTVDRQTAEAARIPFIGVAWGYQDPALLGPRIADRPADLSRFLDPAPSPG